MIQHRNAFNFMFRSVMVTTLCEIALLINVVLLTKQIEWEGLIPNALEVLVNPKSMKALDHGIRGLTSAGDDGIEGTGDSDSEAEDAQACADRARRG